MKNLYRTKNAQIGIALPVAVGLMAGMATALGGAGLRALLITDRATAATVANGTSAPGLKDGEATVELIGVHTTIKAQVTAPVDQFEAAYVTPAGAVVDVAAGNTPIGAFLASTTGPGTVEVALF